MHGRRGDRPLYGALIEAIDEQAVSEFVRDALATRLQAESLVVEFKSKRSGRSVADAVAAMANTDGGIVFVGVDEDEDDHAEPLCGITAGEIDAVIQQLRALLPTTMPEVIPVALPGASERAVLLLRVDADQVDTPVVLRSYLILVRSGSRTISNRCHCRGGVPDSRVSRETERPALRRRRVFVPPAPPPLLPASVTGLRFVDGCAHVGTRSVLPAGQDGDLERFSVRVDGVGLDLT
jgi:hypothetical protein